MKFKIVYSSQLMNTDFNIENPKAEAYLTKKTKFIDNDLLGNWVVFINVIYSSASYLSSILISKKGITYTKDLEKYISIDIPIPTKEQIVWGIDKKCTSYQPIYKDIEKHNYIINFDYSKFDNIQDYIEAAIIFALDNLFKIGFTIKGTKIKEHW
ncbi:hypothetical protein DW940_14060 [Bacteroides uniformis]|jgi:hypothetical protein|uniref:Uncharacterized protein n=2 Tax=Bacteroidaceae TaxID=815 RepID=A0AB73ZBG5_PHOVU|nr:MULTISPECIES: Imm9 family immunity protein [Bacteroidaceae]MBU9020422.1 hypothetical protein [Bacteroides fragilis]MBU9024862.1 hypothetical protein [Bacteroides fragilis]MBU9085356.1 hypothetical protein [Bacteroides fragilis]MCE9116975.1 hypothetical protein [Bacteroides fragilis]RHA29937.1 hypothetical protein DW940_14060 [Bacteroides uniformis]